MGIQLFKPKYRSKEILKEIQECLEIGWTGLGFKTEVIDFTEKYSKISFSQIYYNYDI